MVYNSRCWYDSVILKLILLFNLFYCHISIVFSLITSLFFGSVIIPLFPPGVCPRRLHVVFPFVPPHPHPIPLRLSSPLTSPLFRRSRSCPTLTSLSSRRPTSVRGRRTAATPATPPAAPPSTSTMGRSVTRRKRRLRRRRSGTTVPSHCRRRPSTSAVAS